VVGTVPAPIPPYCFSQNNYTECNLPKDEKNLTGNVPDINVDSIKITVFNVTIKGKSNVEVAHNYIVTTLS
jgi:hypothetical protein